MRVSRGARTSGATVEECRSGGSSDRLYHSQVVEHLIGGVHQLPHLLVQAENVAREIATTTTTAKTHKSSSKPSSVKVSETVLVLIVVGEFAIGTGIAYLRRHRRGIYPWRLHPALWGLIFIVTQGVIGLALIAVAWFFTPTATDPNEPPGRRMFGYQAQQGGAGAPAGRAFGRTPRAAYSGGGSEEGPRFAPGTYGTSLPPHASTATLPPPDEEEAAWLADPTGRHEHRYWNGSRWTKHVADAGERTTDPL